LLKIPHLSSFGKLHAMRPSSLAETKHELSGTKGIVQFFGGVAPQAASLLLQCPFELGEEDCEVVQRAASLLLHDMRTVNRS